MPIIRLVKVSKLDKIIGSIKNKRLWSYFLLVVLILSIPLTLSLTQKKQVIHSHANTTINIGFKVAVLINYGYQDLYPFTNSTDIQTTLQEVQRLNGKVIRIYAANKDVSNEEVSRRLDSFLTQANQYGISVIVSLINNYQDTGNYPQGMDSLYKWNGDPNFQDPILVDSFFAGDYKNSYIPFITTVISENKSHQNIFAWEIGNELKDDITPQNFINFMADVSNTIKTLDPSHKVSSGMLRADKARLTPETLYPFLPHVDIISVVAYNNDYSGLPDLQWANANGKIAVINELGYAGDCSGGNNDRSSNYQQSIDSWKSNNVSLILISAFAPGQITNDNGNMDKTLGMDAVFHKCDYDKLASVILSEDEGSQSTKQPNMPTTTTCPDGTVIPITETCPPTNQGTSNQEA